MTMKTADLHAQYLDLGFQPIPLKSASKLPLVKGWQRQPTVKQWYRAPGDANIGLRAGDGRAFIDCDDKNQAGTFENVTNWLDGLGYHPGSYPVVQTASGVGRHIYVNFTGHMLGSKRDLKIGAGEFCYDFGAYVVSPPSIVDVGTYSLVEGDLVHLPTLDMGDIATLINVTETGEKKSLPRMSHLAQAIIAGNLPEKYKSVSEAEGALVLSLINSGFEFYDIKKIFDRSKALTHYHNHANKEYYLDLTYQNMLAYSPKESPTRRLIRQLQEAAQSTAWERASDKNVFLAHTAIAFTSGKLINGASVRDLAVKAGVASTNTVSKANKRLKEKGLLSEEKENAAYFAKVYGLHPDKLLDKREHSLSNTYVRECSLLSTWKGERIATHDAFRNGKHRLGQRAGEVYELLLAQPMTEKELAEVTGAHVKTIKRALAKLQKVIDRATGEVIEMAKKDGDTWTAELVDLDLIAAIMQTYGARGRQQERYEQERAEHRISLEKGLIKDGDR